MHALLDQFAIPAAALLTVGVAAAFDLKSRRIPNRLTGPAMLAGLLLNFCSGGGRALLASFGALLLCGMVFLVFHLAGGMGAGDVKLIAALGSILGLSRSPALLLLTALSGGVLALAYTLYRGRLRETCGNVLALAAHHTEQGLTPHPDLNVTNAATLRLPYALAIAAGCVFTLLLQPGPVTR